MLQSLDIIKQGLPAEEEIPEIKAINDHLSEMINRIHLLSQKSIDEAKEEIDNLKNINEKLRLKKNTFFYSDAILKNLASIIGLFGDYYSDLVRNAAPTEADSSGTFSARRIEQEEFDETTEEIQNNLESFGRLITEVSNNKHPSARAFYNTTETLQILWRYRTKSQNIEPLEKEINTAIYYLLSRLDSLSNSLSNNKLPNTINISETIENVDTAISAISQVISRGNSTTINKALSDLESIIKNLENSMSSPEIDSPDKISTELSDVLAATEGNLRWSDLPSIKEKLTLAIQTLPQESNQQKEMLEAIRAYASKFRTAAPPGTNCPSQLALS